MLCIMKEVFFNSQTLCQPLDEEVDAKTIVDTYACVVKAAGEKGYKKVRYEEGFDQILLIPTETLKSYCAKHSSRFWSMKENMMICVFLLLIWLIPIL